MNIKKYFTVIALLASVGCEKNLDLAERAVTHDHGISQKFLKDITLLKLSDIFICKNKVFTAEEAINVIVNERTMFPTYVRIFFPVLDNERVTTCLENEQGARTWVSCKYLGSVNGKKVVLCYIFTGCCGITTDLYLCSKIDEKYILQLIIEGNRANDFIMDPVLKSDKLYFEQYVDLRTAAKIAGVSEKVLEKIPENHSQEYWNLSKCVYDFKTNRQQLIETTLYENKEAAECIFTENIFDGVTRELLSFKKYEGKSVAIQQNAIQSFLRQFKKSCEQFYEKKAHGTQPIK